MYSSTPYKFAHRTPQCSNLYAGEEIAPNVNISLMEAVSKTENEMSSAYYSSVMSTCQITNVLKTRNMWDRFIPARTTLNFDLGYFKLQRKENRKQGGYEMNTLTQKMRHLLEKHVYGGNINNSKLFSYHNKNLAPVEGHMTLVERRVSNEAENADGIIPYRKIPQNPHRVLEAHDFVDDYYANVFDLSTNNTVAIAVKNLVAVYNDACKTGQDFAVPEEECIYSLSWSPYGSYLAVGTSTGNVELWDCNVMKKICVMDGNNLSSKVTSLSWNSHIISSACSDGVMVHHDPRQRNHIISSIITHDRKQICGLKWSPDGKYLASGGLDCTLQIWSNTFSGRNVHGQPIYSFRERQNIVKALAWCPWRRNLLASGGGNTDKTIRIWNCNNGTCLTEIGTESQVCSLVWSKEYRELISAHGYNQNQLVMWKYPTMTTLMKFKYHRERILYLAIFSDETMIVTVDSKGWVCFWDWTQSQSQKTKRNKRVSMPFMNQLIR